MPRPGGGDRPGPQQPARLLRLRRRLPGFQPANPNLPAVALNSGVNNGNVTVNFGTGPASANVTILVNGGQKAQGFLILGPNGQGSTTVPLPGGIVRGDTVTVLVNGCRSRTSATDQLRRRAAPTRLSTSFSSPSM